MKITTKYLLGGACIWLMAILCAFTIVGSDDFDLAKQEIMLRKIGHQILLQSGDSTSRVLPVKRVGDDEYQITFENELTFQSDSLVAVVKNALIQNKLSHNYIVNVLNCSGNDVIFGYSISGNAKDNIVACSGRKQAKSCYRVNIKFEQSGVSAKQKVYMLGGIPLLGFVGFLIFGAVDTRKKRKVVLKAESSLKIGNTLFNPDKRELIFENTITELTAKENKLLLILATCPNTIVERSRLQKEIWEDEGVIVGRSLDVFVSKLRKKLEGDTAIKLSNIHGRGYRLEVGG